VKVDDSLVTAITKALIERLRAGELHDGDSGAAGVKRPLVIAGAESALSGAALRALENDFSLIPYESAVPEDAALVVTSLGIQALVRLAEGDDGCTPEGAAVLAELLKGKTPFVLEEGIAWRSFTGMRKTLAAKYAAHERTLASYGVVFVKEADLLSVLRGTSRYVAPAAPQEVRPAIRPEAVAPRLTKRVINEMELMRLCPVAGGKKQIIEIGGTDILTPLALDYAAKMEVGIRRI
jgi:hypothetical protein